MKTIATLAALSLLIIGQAHSQNRSAVSNQKKETMNNKNQGEQYTFQLSDKVTRQKVTFKNRYGISVGRRFIPS